MDLQISVLEDFMYYTFKILVLEDFNIYYKLKKFYG